MSVPVNPVDFIALYGEAHKLPLRTKTVLVEGTTDASLFRFAADLEREHSGKNLFCENFAIVAAGEGERGGTRGVIREMIALRGLARSLLLPNGRPRYRFIALFDNDRAGRQAIISARELDMSLIEYRDLFRTFPIMPQPKNLDAGSVQRSFENENNPYRGIDWEIEDYFDADFLSAFTEEHSTAIIKHANVGGKIHREFTADGKARFHHFLKQYGTHSDMLQVIQLLRSLRFYFGLPYI